MIWSGCSPSRRARLTPRSWSASARPARVAGSDGTPADRSGATTSGPAPTRNVPARRAGDGRRHGRRGRDRGRCRRRRSRPSGPSDDVDPFEGGDDRALGRPERGRGRRQPDVGAAFGGGRSIARRSWVSARWLPVGAVRCARVRGRRWSRGPPLGHLETRVGQPVGQLAPDRDLDAEEVDTRGDQAATSSRAPSMSGSRRVAPSHGRVGVAEHPEVSRRTVRWASMRSMAALASRWASASATRAGRARGAVRLRARGRSRPTRRPSPAGAGRGRTRAAPSRTAGRSRSRGRSGRRATSGRRSRRRVAARRHRARSPRTAAGSPAPARPWSSRGRARPMRRRGHPPAPPGGRAASRTSRRERDRIGDATGTSCGPRPPGGLASMAAGSRSRASSHRSTAPASRIPARKPR